MQVVAIVPAWMLADGAYVGLAVGQRVTTGLALAVIDATVAPAATVGLEQSDEQPGFTTVTGRVECPQDPDGARVGTVLCSGAWAVVPFAASPLSAGECVVASGWLTAEPYLWAAGGALARAVPAGRQVWRVGQVRCVGDGDDPHSIERLPEQADVDPDAAYLLELSAAD
ncbi:hypothetical protein LQ327_19120 [Actinomycetospora endophytica]|uniref:Uncharacterized protein n=1 Tax=Actinomycetospora endophytica TaxID=2291215 RepID=A0ABS8PBG6_9PSEU|nr:hypothetical protein [Actinomycetospora endophytica]MCD2195484.1 hypothetical protein [Actinomycetospora endophytica]